VTARAHILIVEDERGLVITLRDRLTREGYAVETAAEPDEALRLVSERHFDLVLLDLMLRGGSGMDVCSQMRTQGLKTPVIMLTARSALTDKVVGLKMGADDYLTKPFEMAELLARIEVQIRRRQTDASPAQVAPAGLVRFGAVEVDLRGAEVRRQGQVVPLSAKEFHLLRYFVEHQGATVGRDELLDAVWRYDSMPNTRTVDVHVAALRRKLEPNPRAPDHIITVHGLGYKFVG
jgi:two-component system, OmpR family, alkaline phosphatase synthesis response regulator PhoP